MIEKLPSIKISGQILDQRGIIGGYSLTPLATSPTDFILSWDHASLFPGEYGYSVYLNGVWAVNAQTNSCVLTGLVPGQYLEISIIPWIGAPDADYQQSTLFAVPQRGQRLLLNWTALTSVQCPTLVGYRLYWDEGLGGTPSHVCGLLWGRSKTQWLSSPLAMGTYQFAVTALYSTGDESVKSPVVSAQVIPPPQAVTSQELVYSHGQKTATVTASKPLTQSGGCRGYVLFWNYMPQASSLGNLIEGQSGQVIWVPVSGTLTYTTQTLFPGLHRFAWASVDVTGQYSDYRETDLELILSGPDLIRPPARPDPPLSVTCTPGLAGTELIKVSVDNQAVSVQYWINGVLYQTISGMGLNQSVSYPVQDAAAYSLSVNTLLTGVPSWPVTRTFTGVNKPVIAPGTPVIRAIN